MIKKLILLSGALLLCMLVFFNCNKESQGEQTEKGKENSFSISQAQSWYDNQAAQSPSSSGLSRASSKKIGAFSPQWNKAIRSGDNTYDIVECPLRFDNKPGFTISNKDNTKDSIHGRSRLLILKNKKTGAIRSALMHIYATSNDNDSGITYSKRGNHFSGYVFFTELNGDFINGWQYKDGVIIRQSKKASLSDNTASKALPPPDEDCEYYEIRWYEQDCNYYTDGSSECTDWYYLGSTYESYCTPGGGGSDGGGGVDGDGVKTLEELLANFDDNIVNSLTHNCLKAILEQILNLKNGKIGEIINQFSGEVPNWNWQLQEGTLPVNQNGQTTLMSGGALTTLDYNKLFGATNLAIARTIIHESIHAYLTVYFRNDPVNATKDYPGMYHAWMKAKHPDYNQIQHDEMEKSFVDDIALALKDFGQARGYQLDDSVYNDLAWGGLDFDNSSQLSDDDKARIQNRISAEQTNSTYDTESPAGQKACN